MTETAELSEAVQRAERVVRIAVGTRAFVPLTELRAHQRETNEVLDLLATELLRHRATIIHSTDGAEYAHRNLKMVTAENDRLLSVGHPVQFTSHQRGYAEELTEQLANRDAAVIRWTALVPAYRAAVRAAQ